jgi:hypothetical protein
MFLDVNQDTKLKSSQHLRTFTYPATKPNFSVKFQDDAFHEISFKMDMWTVVVVG